MVRTSRRIWLVITCLLLLTGGCRLRPDVTIAISPSEVTLAPGEMQVFVATVVGERDPSVAWAASGGDVMPSGAAALYTAPEAVGVFEVAVRSTRDASLSASAVVRVEPAAGGVVSLEHDVKVGEAVVRFIGPGTVEVTVSGTGVREVALPAGSYVVAAGLVEAVSMSSSLIDVFVPELSQERVDVEDGGRTAVSLEYRKGAVRGDTWVRLRPEDVVTLVQVTPDRLEFEDPPAAVLAMEIGDVLYLPPGVLPVEDRAGVELAEVGRSDDTPSCGFTDEGSYVVVLGFGSQGRRSFIDYVPASIADLFIQVIDVRGWCEFSGTFNVSLPGVGDFVSTQIVFDAFSVDVRISGQEMFSNPFWPETDFQWLVLQSAGCMADPTSVLCRKWFVVTKLDVDITADSVGPAVGLTLSKSLERAWSKDIIPVALGPLPIRANIGVDFTAALAATLLKFEYSGPLVIEYRYENQIGDGRAGVGSDERAFSWEPEFKVVTPDLDGGGVFSVEAVVGAMLFVSVSDPVRIAEVYVRAGAEAAVTRTLGDPLRAADTYPFSVDASLVVGAGYRDRFGGRYESRGPTFDFTFEPPFFTFANSKLHFEDLARVAGSFRLEHRIVGASRWVDQTALGHAFALLLPKVHYEVRLIPLGGFEGVVRADCEVSSSGSSVLLVAPGPKEICAVWVESDAFDLGKPVVGIGDDEEFGFGDPEFDALYGVLKAGLDTSDGTLRLSTRSSTFPFIWIALSARGTIAKIDTSTGEVLGEYRTTPVGVGANPSRTTVGLDGSVWAGNRGSGYVVHVGLREAGQCIDRDGDGVITTSSGYGDVLPWPAGGDPVDECILHLVDHVGADARHVSVNADGNIWVGSYSGSNSRVFQLIDSASGTIVRTEGAFACGGYGGLIDRSGVLWSASRASGVLRWDPNAPIVAGENPRCLSVPNYGLAIDALGWIWASTYDQSDSSVRKISPDGNTVLGPFNHGNVRAQGLAVDEQGHVWVSSSLGCTSNCTVGHLLNDGTFVGRVPSGAGSTGVAVDAEGKIWTANINASSATRIDPNAGPLGADGATRVGEVDLTVPLPGARPYNYSDMTGRIARTITTIQGTWNATIDSETAGFEWQRVIWRLRRELPAGTGVEVKVRAADERSALGSIPYTQVESGADLPGLVGRYLQIEVKLFTEVEGETPEIESIRLF